MKCHAADANGKGCNLNLAYISKYKYSHNQNCCDLYHYATVWPWNLDYIRLLTCKCDNYSWLLWLLSYCIHIFFWPRSWIRSSYWIRLSMTLGTFVTWKLGHCHWGLVSLINSDRLFWLLSYCIHMFLSSKSCMNSTITFVWLFYLEI